jgi:hypothetical protein
MTNIIPIEDILVRSEVFETKFSCDLEKCKGACCTLESEFGAPIQESEIAQIEEILHIVKDYIPDEHYNVIKSEGFYEIKGKEILIKSVRNAACVFVRYENGIAKCGIEKAYFDKKVTFRKPISCHLFPIRVSSFGNDVLRYEKFSECKPALAKGEAENISIAEFCKDSLVRKYGEPWYKKFIKEGKD